MIQFATDNIEPQIRQMWNTSFDTTEEYLDLFFSEVYTPENTLVYFEEGKAVASLQILPYTINFYGTKLPFGYLAGLCTLPEARRKGYMAQLIHQAHEILKERNIALSILVPAEDWLFSFYEKFDYLKVFEKGEDILSLKHLLDKYVTLEEAFKAFNTAYCDRNLCVLKSFNDFKTMVKESKMDDFPKKQSLSAMAYIVNREALLKIWGRESNLNNIDLCRQIFAESKDRPMISYMLE